VKIVRDNSPHCTGTSLILGKRRNRRNKKRFDLEGEANKQKGGRKGKEDALLFLKKKQRTPGRPHAKKKQKGDGCGGREGIG